MTAAVAELTALAPTLGQAGGSIRLDLTLAGEMEYYNGLVFQGYLKALPRPLLKGGRYDLLMQKFTPGAGAIGFAVYLDELDRLNAPMPPVQHQDTGKVMLNVALPKGRLGDKVYNLLAGIGYGCPEDYNATRKLVVENPAAGIRYFLVKPSDVAIYVEHGAADVGIVGKDILTEASADVYELLDTGLGRCRMCVAAPADYQDDPSRPVRVATKFVNIAKSYYASMGRDIDIIKLNGSIELAPILGLSDVIVDIVETGTTLRENGLKVVTEFMPVSARFIANKASYQFKHNADGTHAHKAAGSNCRTGGSEMIKLYDFDSLKPEEILNRDIRAEKNVEDVVDAILADVRTRGDEALKEYALKFDGAEIENLQVTQEEIEDAFANMDPYFLETLKEAAANIESFHRQQVHKNFVVNDKPGIVLGRRDPH